MLIGPRKLVGPWTTTRSKQYLCAVLWVRCRFDPLQVWGCEWGVGLTPSKFGGVRTNEPWIETFHKFLSKICVSPTIHVSWPNLAKIGRWEVAEKCCLQKTSAPGPLEPPISPPLNQSRPTFRERCRLLTCVCAPTLVRIGCGLPDLFWKESKKVNTI